MSRHGVGRRAQRDLNDTAAITAAAHLCILISMITDTALKYQPAWGLLFGVGARCQSERMLQQKIKRCVICYLLSCVVSSKDLRCGWARREMDGLHLFPSDDLLVRRLSRLKLLWRSFSDSLALAGSRDWHDALASCLQMKNLKICSPTSLLTILSFS